MGSDVGVRRTRRVAGAGAGRCLPIALAVALSLCAPAAAYSHPCPRAAHRAARALLRRVVLPLGARAGGSASEATPMLPGPNSQPKVPNQLDVHGFWHLPGDPEAAARWLHGHPPRLASIRGGASNAGIWWVRFAFSPHHRHIASEELVLALARASDGGTLLRADAQVVWVPRRE
jgi:hypothetical protein